MYSFHNNFFFDGCHLFSGATDTFTVQYLHTLLQSQTAAYSGHVVSVACVGSVSRNALPNANAGRRKQVSLTSSQWSHHPVLVFSCTLAKRGCHSCIVMNMY